MSIVYRSAKGSKLTSAEVDGNFQHLENLVGGEGNSVIEQNGFALLDQDLTINSGWNWRILGVLYTNTSSVVISIPFATTENHRIDLIVANQSNTFERIAGIESTSNPIAPTIPSNKIAISFITVTDGVVGVPTEPIIGTQFKKKSENLGYGYPLLKGTRAVIQLRPEGNSYYYVGSPLLVSVDGFGTSLITGNPDAEIPYPMKDLFIHNTGTTPFTLLHNGTGSANSKFFFLDENDLVVPPGGKVWLKYGGTYCQLFLTSWTEQSIPTFQQVTQSGNTTEEVIEAAGYRSRGYANVSGITFNDGALNDVANLRSVATSDNVMTYTFPNDNGTVALREWVYDKFASKENLLQYNYAFSETIDSIRLELPATESYLIIDSLIESINGFDVPFSDLFEGKDYFIYNNSSDVITLKHNYDNDTYDFNFKKGSDIIVPLKGIIHLKFIGGKFIDVNQSWEDFNELQGINISDTKGGEVLTYNSSTQLWENKKVYNDLQIRRTGITVFDDMTSNGNGISPFTKNTFNAGAFAVSTTFTEDTPGVISISSVSSSTNGGGNISMISTSAARPLAFKEGYQFDAIINLPAVVNNVILRCGILTGTVNPTQPTDGVYFEVTGASLVGRTANGSVRSSTAAYTLSENTWYHLRIVINSLSLITYHVYSINGTLLSTLTLDTNIPATNTGVQPILIVHNTTAENRTLINIDYISVTYPQINRGALT